MEIINVTIIYDKEGDKHKETSSAYDIKGEGNTLSMSENKEISHDGYVRMYEWGKHLLYPTYECMCASQEITISKMKEIVKIYNSKIK